MIGDPEFLNKVISIELAEYLKKHTQSFEWHDAAEKANMSFATVRNLVYRQTPITEGNKDSVIELMKTAIKNAMLSRENDTKAETFIQEVLKTH